MKGATMRNSCMQRRVPRTTAWRILLLLVLVATSLLTYFGSSLAGSIELAPVLDNTLFATTEGESSSGVGPALFFGANSQSSIRRAVLAFDLEDIPVGVTVDSVALRIHVSQAPNEDPQAMTVHRLLASWGEGASASGGGSGAPSEAGDATWLHRFYPDSLWKAGGGDFADAPSASAVIGSEGFYFVKDPGLVTDVAGWLVESRTNFGWLLHGSESVPSSARRIDSREGTDSMLWPQLIIHFTEPVPTQTLTWGRIKTLFESF